MPHFLSNPGFAGFLSLLGVVVALPSLIVLTMAGLRALSLVHFLKGRWEGELSDGEKLGYKCQMHFFLQDNGIFGCLHYEGKNVDGYPAIGVNRILRQQLKIRKIKILQKIEFQIASKREAHHVNINGNNIVENPDKDYYFQISSKYKRGYFRIYPWMQVTNVVKAHTGTLIERSVSMSGEFYKHK